MQQHIYYTKYALQFADMQIPELVNEFNQNRCIDMSAVSDGRSISFAKQIKYDLGDNKLIVID